MYTKELIQTKDQFGSLLSRLDEAGIFAYDVETNGQFDRFKRQMVGISFGFPDYACYIPLAHEEGEQLLFPFVLGGIKTCLLDPSKEKICHNAKFDESVLKGHGIEVQGVGHDTYVMCWLLAEDTSTKKLKPQVLKHLGYKMETWEEIIEAQPRKRGEKVDYNFGKVPLDRAVSYAADDSYWTFKLYEFLNTKLEQQKLVNAYKHVECPIGRTIKNIEEYGIQIDDKAITRAHERLPQIVDEVDAEIYEEIGEVFKISSGKQLGPILFEKLGIGQNVPKTPTGQYKTDKKTLELYASQHPIVEKVLRRKKIAKTHSTFVEGIQKFVAQDGRLHASFNPCGTVTGRLSSSKPNLQNIETDEVEEVKVRDFFIPSEGNKFIVVDYGQVELRVMAHFAKDQKMIDAFNSGRHFHTETARMMYNIPEDEAPTTRHKFHAKAINFGIGYGRSEYSISEQLGCSVDDALEVIAKWHEQFPGIQPLKERVWTFARVHGYIRTISGKKRRLPDIVSPHYGIRMHAERQAFSTKIQGSAADIIKIAMIALEPKLKDFDAHMCIQIHDELVIDCPEGVVDECKDVVQHTMEFPVNGKNPLRLPLVADANIVNKWSEAK